MYITVYLEPKRSWFFQFLISCFSQLQTYQYYLLFNMFWLFTDSHVYQRTVKYRHSSVLF